MRENTDQKKTLYLDTFYAVFVPDTSKISILLIICDARNWNLVLIEFILIFAKMGRLRYSSFNDFRLIFWYLSFSLSLSTWLLDRLDFLLKISSSYSSVILAYVSFFQNFLICSKKFIAKCRDPDSFKCKPFATQMFIDDISIINYVNIWLWQRFG